MKRIIVVMSTYNGADCLEKQIESIFAQKGVEVSCLVRDDGSTDNDNRLGAVKDIAFAINECNLTGADKNVCEDGVLVLAGDNLLDFSIKGFLDFYKEKNAMHFTKK